MMRTLDDNLLIAHMRLLADPRITVYTFDADGEHRQPARPWRNTTK